MVALRGSAAEAYVARPDHGQPVALIFGPDAGLVSERVRLLVEASVDDVNDPFALVRLDGDDLASDPARLIDEAATIPLFGGRRGIWIKAGSRDFGPAIEALLAGPTGSCRVVIEAGELRPGAPLRAVCERHAKAVAIGCYADGERDIGRLIDQEMRAAGLTVAADARAALIPLLGADRAASISELRKLALYARGSARVEIEDVMAIVADASGLALDTIVDAAFAGRSAEVEAQFARAGAAGIAPGGVISVALAQVAQLHRSRIAMDAGSSPAEAADQVVSKAQFRRRPAVEAALKSWTSGRLEQAMAQLADAALEIRRLTGPAAALADPIASRCLLAIAGMARRRQ